MADPIITRGQIRVNRVDRIVYTPQLRVWYIDCVSKYVEAALMYGDRLTLILSANEDTLRWDRRFKTFTRVDLGPIGDWDAMCDSGRYTVRVVAWKRQAVDRNAVAAEREACAQIADQCASDEGAAFDRRVGGAADSREGRLNRRELLLIVALKLPKRFTLSDLIIVAWQEHPEIFGMNSYPYPDSNKIVPRVYGERGLIRRGFLRWREDQLEIAPAGRRRLRGTQ